MSKEFKLRHLLLSLMVLGFSLSFSSCGDDDDPKKEEITVEAVEGEYSGTMAISAGTYAAIVELNESAGKSVDVTATVTGDSIVFDDFPVKDIAASLVSGLPDEVLNNLTVQYKMAYIATVNGAKNGLDITLSPKPMELTLTLSEDVVQEIKVEISASEKGGYVAEGKKLTFSIKANSVTVNDEPIGAFPEMTFGFSLTQK